MHLEKKSHVYMTTMKKFDYIQSIRYRHLEKNAPGKSDGGAKNQNVKEKHDFTCQSLQLRRNAKLKKYNLDPLKKTPVTDFSIATVLH